MCDKCEGKKEYTSLNDWVTLHLTQGLEQLKNDPEFFANEFVRYGCQTIEISMVAINTMIEYLNKIDESKVAEKLMISSEEAKKLMIGKVLSNLIFLEYNLKELRDAAIQLKQKVKDFPI